MSAYYNERDPYAAKWLRNLIAAGLIADGDVDERDIQEVQPADLRGYTQHHFFAGIGGWSLALRIASWSDARPIWTGSPPCQPFSVAGKRRGTDDERHLWPAFFALIRECRPPVIVGEQVASAIAYGWYDTLCDDLEAEGYACGAVVAPACSVGAPHIRERLFWVANADERPHREGRADVRGRADGGAAQPWPGFSRRGVLDRMADTDSQQRRAGAVLCAGAEAWQPQPGDGGGAVRPSALDNQWRDLDWLGCRDGKWRPVEPGTQPLAHGVSARVGKLRAYGNAVVPQIAAQFVMGCSARGAA